MKALDVSGFAAINNRLFPAALITLRVDNTGGFSTLSLSCGDETMLQIPVTDSVKETLKGVI